MKVLFRVLGAAAAVAATGAAILALDKLLTRKKDPCRSRQWSSPMRPRPTPARQKRPPPPMPRAKLPPQRQHRSRPPLSRRHSL